MNPKQKIIIGLLSTIIVTALTLAGNTPAAVTLPSDQSQTKDLPAALNDFDALLKEHVDDKGMVNYQKIKARPVRLNTFLAALAAVKKTEFDRWPENQKIAFWINAYNAYTLKAIIDNYPVKSSFFKSLRFPKNSIRQIDGVWDKLKFNVQGQKLTLEHIEHKELRAKFSEPRIHMALVCAAMGRPPLRNQAYRGPQLNDQLDDQSKKFMAHPGKFKIDRAAQTVHLSQIFKWFGDDFTKKYLPDIGFADHTNPQRASLNFAAKYLPPADAEYLRDKKYKIKHLNYDWALNEQKKK
jgi:hypothetical protein